jgi:hypothetical protein
MANTEGRDSSPRDTDDFESALEAIGGDEAAANGSAAGAREVPSAPAKPAPAKGEARGKSGGKGGAGGKGAAKGSAKAEAAPAPAADGREQSFLAALAAARRAPDNDAAWSHVEELADALQRPDDVADLYRELLEFAGRSPSARCSSARFGTSIARSG